MHDTIDDALELTRALLSQTRMAFREGAPTLPPEEVQALAGWGFSTREDTITADVYVYADYETIQAALAQLQAHYGVTPDAMLPAISQNGPLVFVVRLLSTPADRKGFSAALDVASALAGEE